MSRRHRAIIQHHIASGTASQEQRTGTVPTIRFEQGGKTQLKPSIEEPLGHLVLGGHQQRNVGRFQRALEQLDEPSVLQFEIRSEGGLAHRAGGVDAAQEADLIVGLGGVPLSETVDVDVAGVSETFARRDHGIVGGVFFVEAHVAGGYIAWNIRGSGSGGGMKSISIVASTTVGNSYTSVGGIIIVGIV